MKVSSKTLGVGSFARVTKGEFENRDVAIKIFNFLWEKRNEKRQPEKLEEIFKEYKLMTVLEHKNVVQVFGFILYDGCLGLVMEFANGGTLTELIPKSNFRQNVQLQYQILLDIAEGLKFIHFKKIMHRDIKPDNILICKESDDSLIAKITDLGEARVPF